MSSSIKSQIPVDIMLEILDNLDKSDLATMCRLNKLCCALAQPVLFRDVRFQFSDKSEFGLLRNHAREYALWRRLSQSPHLAKYVRLFSVKVSIMSIHLGPRIAETLEFLPSLRHLGLIVYDDFTNYIYNHLLKGRTFSFKLESLTLHLPNGGTHLRDFLNSQPSLTTVSIRFFIFRTYVDSRMELERKCLPNLTRVTTSFLYAEEIIRGRPVSEITCIGERGVEYNITLDFFALSTAPIRKLTIEFDFLHNGAKPGQLRVLFPSLAHLTLTSCCQFSDMISVRVSLRPLIKLFKYVIARPRLLW
jgi:hypothetical protein